MLTLFRAVAVAMFAIVPRVAFAPIERPACNWHEELGGACVQGRDSRYGEACDMHVLRNDARSDCRR